MLSLQHGQINDLYLFNREYIYYVACALCVDRFSDVLKMQET